MHREVGSYIYIFIAFSDVIIAKLAIFFISTFGTHEIKIANYLLYFQFEQLYVDVHSNLKTNNNRKNVYKYIYTF